MTMFTMEPLVPAYYFKFSFEANFNPGWGQRWMAKYWTLSIVLAALYLAIVYRSSKRKSVLQRGVEYKVPLLIWNVSLLVFNVLGVLRTFPELAHSLLNFGLHHTICDAAYLQKDPVAGFWTFFGVLSKVIELGDILFVVSMGRQMILLHGIRRASLLIISWLIYGHKMAALRWFIVTDFYVHSFVYAYYAARTLGLQLPKIIAFAITALQILQKVSATYLSLYAYLCWWYNEFCDVTGTSAHVTLILNFISFVMLTNYFYTTYLENIQALEKKRQ